MDVMVPVRLICRHGRLIVEDRTDWTPAGFSLRHEIGLREVRAVDRVDLRRVENEWKVERPERLRCERGGINLTACPCSSAGHESSAQIHSFGDDEISE